MSEEEPQRFEVEGGEVEVKDGFAFYRGTRPFEELEALPEPEDMTADFNWAMADPEVRQLYGGQVVAVRNRKVWGAGKSYQAAYEQACLAPGCPADDLVFVIVSGPIPDACQWNG
jgi:hypothetical protein